MMMMNVKHAVWGSVNDAVFGWEVTKEEDQQHKND